MEQFFPDGGHVRLRSRVRRKYLHAATDGIGVLLSPERASFNAAWRVHRVVRNGVPLVLLHGAAYGRYLAASDDHRVVQGVYDDLEADDVMWTAVEAAGDHLVLLRHVSGRFLRANGSWKKGVTVDYNPSTPMMHWEVESLKLQPETPDIPPPRPHVRELLIWCCFLPLIWNICAWLTSIISLQVRCFLGCFHRRRVAPFPERTIRCIRADYFGNFNDDHGWAAFQFEGRSVYLLRWDVMSHVGVFITLCTRAGRYGRLTPLVTDLPRILLPMDIIGLTIYSPGDNLFALLA
ncbi:unnamed protein product [Urochloa decumbens]|uniref:DUF569 domain-containing protein n=1 Tax=Urochloa decumbens TaxID=240449 RepID=A0ABC9FYQ4_9POAL